MLIALIFSYHRPCSATFQSVKTPQVYLWTAQTNRSNFK